MMMKEWTNRLPPAASGSTLYAAVDLGKMNDQTVISIGQPLKARDERDDYHDLEVHYLEELPLRTPYDQIADRMTEIRDHYENLGVNTIWGHDSTGQKTFGDFLTKQKFFSKEVDFSRKESNKTLLYNDFKLMAEKRKIKIVYSKACEEQLGNLMFKLTENKKLKKVENKSDTMHDDYPDSIVILIHLAVKPSHITPSVTIVGRNPPKQKEEGPSGSADLKAYEAKVLRNNNSWNKKSVDPYG
jgi:hypothetical protein